MIVNTLKLSFLLSVGFHLPIPFALCSVARISISQSTHISHFNCPPFPSSISLQSQSVPNRPKIATQEIRIQIMLISSLLGSPPLTPLSPARRCYGYRVLPGHKSFSCPVVHLSPFLFVSAILNSSPSVTGAFVPFVFFSFWIYIWYPPPCLPICHVSV